MQLVHYKYLSATKLYTSACCSLIFDYLYSKHEIVIISNRRRLPENRKNYFLARKNSFS